MSDFKVTRYKLRALGMSVRGPEEPFSIVFLSDLHNKSYGKGNERLLQEIRNQDPEAVLIGGDLLTSADPPQMEAALELMKELAKGGMTMVCVTHEMGFARNVSTKTMFMDKGTVVESGPSAELFANPKEERTRAFLNTITQHEKE